MERQIEKNQATISGEIVSGFTFSHQIYGEGFYMMDVQVKRLSDQYDTIPVMVSERLVDVSQSLEGYLANISGQFRSYNKHEENKNRLVLSVFAREFGDTSEIDADCDINKVYLDGYICKEPIYRKTPLGREICDILLAVNRPYGKSDYIPCICWGRNARYAEGLQVGDRIEVEGRIQSREYIKRIDEERTEQRTAFEVSVSKVSQIVESEDCTNED